MVPLAVFLVLVLAASPAVSSLKLTDLTKICEPKDPELGPCIVKMAQEMLAKMENGLPEWGVPKLDPLKVPTMNVQRGGGAAAFNITLIDSYHHGLSEIRFLSASARPKNYELRFKVWLPRYSIVGKYDMSGRLLLLPITGRGDSNITLSNLTAEWTLRGKPMVRDGLTYMDQQQFRVKVFPEKVRVRFENLFEGNRLLGATMNNLLNTHWKELYKDLGPGLEEAISQLHLALTKKMFSKIPFTEFFPDQ
ncbi:protein takeout-like [Ischnura elegans]|uniref:protein takeout-like n=1 Tax=Ischnura elegans TaxID=197161 RepID=UPI001ED86F18|nr:protein takeout-like [Ischnura elegans]